MASITYQNSTAPFEGIRCACVWGESSIDAGRKSCARDTAPEPHGLARIASWFGYVMVHIINPLLLTSLTYHRRVIGRQELLSNLERLRQTFRSDRCFPFEDDPSLGRRAEHGCSRQSKRLIGMNARSSGVNLIAFSIALFAFVGRS